MVPVGNLKSTLHVTRVFTPNTEVDIPLERFLRSPYIHVAPLTSEDRGEQGRPMTPLVHPEQVASCLHLIKHPCGP